MKFLYILIFSLATSLVTKAQTTIIDSFISDGVMRSYTLFVPASYSASVAAPLVINMHGLNSNMSQQLDISQFNTQATAHNFLVVYPQATAIAYLGGMVGWNVDQNPDAVDDVQFLSNLIDSIAALYTINPNRIYSTGMSHGGYMSYTLACALSNRIAAIASVTGTMNATMKSNCTPTRAVPVMQMHGTTDPIVAYGGNANGLAVDTVIKDWVARNNCNAIPSYDSIPNTNVADNTYAHHFVYSGGDNGSTVEFYKIYDGGHTWPGSAFFVPLTLFVGKTCMDYDASTEIWRFFNQYTLTGPTTTHNNVENNTITIFPNPTADYIHIQGNDGEAISVSITDMSGRVLLTSNHSSIKVSSLSAGVYLISVTCQGSTITQKFLKN